MRLVAYSYPKWAVQFLKASREVAMLELETWNPVLPAPEQPPQRRHFGSLRCLLRARHVQHLHQQPTSA
jgi:hypothetical protein